MFQKPFFQSQSFAGSVEGTVTQSGRDSHIIQDNNVNLNKPITTDEILRLLGHIESLVHESTLPENTSSKAISHIKAAQNEVQQDQPSKDFVALSLKRFVDLLKDSNQAANELQKLQPILGSVASWLGAARQILGI
ncbi:MULTISPECIES: hypothetical protein [Pseudanabaena]|uniref:Uncharacterized protein n=2 Tax=Pseudanabaena TaxID=1152 RepID=L8MY92_9CYAN|nr:MULTISPECIES: hypothetical protein [Pseudanabaena]ELS32977.1 hypothetical protein Pse7429DRAFT_1863 [Pseudanabaena biceps PCC 7429]MDG3494777.1 hypothetical protein [Pseudanabaena catenata USMAC16]